MMGLAPYTWQWTSVADLCSCTLFQRQIRWMLRRQLRRPGKLTVNNMIDAPCESEHSIKGLWVIWLTAFAARTSGILARKSKFLSFFCYIDTQVRRACFHIVTFWRWAVVRDHGIVWRHTSREQHLKRLLALECPPTCSWKPMASPSLLWLTFCIFLCFFASMFWQAFWHHEMC